MNRKENIIENEKVEKRNNGLTNMVIQYAIEKQMSIQSIENAIEKVFDCFRMNATLNKLD